MNSHVATALGVLRSNPDAGYEELYQKTLAEVGDEDLAHRLIEFVPLAYSKLLLEFYGVRYAREYQRSKGKKLTHKCPLSSEPMWSKALQAAYEERDAKVPVEELVVIASRDPLFAPIMNSIAKGQNMKGAVMSIVILREAPMPCPPPPWWKFW